MSRRQTRRSFLKTTLAAGAAAVSVPYFIPSRTLGASMLDRPRRKGYELPKV